MSDATHLRPQARSTPHNPSSSLRPYPPPPTHPASFLAKQPLKRTRNSQENKNTNQASTELSRRAGLASARLAAVTDNERAGAEKDRLRGPLDLRPSFLLDQSPAKTSFYPYLLGYFVSSCVFVCVCVCVSGAPRLHGSVPSVDQTARRLFWAGVWK